MAAIDYVRVSICRERSMNEELTDTDDVYFVVRIERPYHRSRAPEVAADGMNPLLRVFALSLLAFTLSRVLW